MNQLPAAQGEPVTPGDIEGLIEDAQKLPGVAESLALAEAVARLIPALPNQVIVTRYATGGNLGDAHVG